MSHPLYVAFVWHQHQPLYKSPTGQYQLPWVRLHGTKDYLDLILLLEKFPRLHQTVNLVPSLMMQLEDYAEGKALDPYLKLALSEVNGLNTDQKWYIIEHFFDGNHRTLIDPHPRYSELYCQRQEEGRAWCLENWHEQDFSDLLAWHNLAWIDPLFWDDPEIATWLAKGKGFSLGDRQRIYSKQRDIIKRIIPKHKEMQDNGQLEVTTTPYTHPILPLLANTDAGRVAVPEMALPENRFMWAEDIPRHLHRAKEMYRDRFGREVRGLWPSEQSVSPEVLDPIAAAGFKWICSDEAVLGWSIKHFFHRDEVGNVYEPEIMYQPYRLETPSGDLSIVFRDHRLSDLVGFTYGGMNAEVAASDLVGHLEAIARSLRHKQENPRTTTLENPHLVTIALDGENCWEFYERDGIPFLTALYEKLSAEKNIELVTVSEFTEKFPPTTTIPSKNLHSGSWVDGSFTTWIGDPAKNRAWDLLFKARKTLEDHPEATEITNPEAWESLFAAEGSDWFWWFGEGHSSNQDAMFDQLFREHIAGIYTALNEPVPPEVMKPVEKHDHKKAQMPQSFIHPIIDGVGDEQDWDKAGCIQIGGARGTMHQSSALQKLFYGWDHLNFYLRFDLRRGVKWGEELPSELHLLAFYPGVNSAISPAPIASMPDQEPLNYLFRHHIGINLLTKSIWFEEAIDFGQWCPKVIHAKMEYKECLELAVPWDVLGVKPEYRLNLVAILADDGEYHSFVPENQFVTLQVP